MKTTLAVALATVVPGGLVILAAMYLWHLLARRRLVARRVPALAERRGIAGHSRWAAGSTPSAAALDRTM